jgi:uncharacterized protein YdaU (DUF1376 family)
MSLPYFNFYPKDFEADTSHLTLEEDGAYNRLLRLCWMTPGCSLPDDDAWIMRRMRVDAEAFERAVRPVLAEFFIRKAGRISNARMTKEHHKSDVAHQRRVSAGSQGGKAKALNSKDKAPSNAVAMPKQPEPEPEPDKKEDVGKPTSPADKPPDKMRLPEDWALSDEGWAYARSQGIPDKVIEDEARGFHAYWTDRRDRDAKKSCRGWEQCWANRCRTIAARYQRSGGMAFQAIPGGHGQGGSLASIAARRRAAGAV